MGKVIGILFVVVGLWAVLEIFNEGAANAFGGIFASAGLVEAETGEERLLPQRRGAKVARAHAEAEARRNRLLAE